MSARTLRVERAVNELVYELPAGVASKDAVDEHMQLLVEDYGLSVDRAQAATRHYLTTTREGVAACLVSQLAQTTDTPPTREAIVAELEFLADWRIPLGDAYEVVRREYGLLDRADRDHADSADHADPLRGVPQGATDAEVAAAIPSLDDHEWSSTSDLADPDDPDILDADTRETTASDGPGLYRPQTGPWTTVVTRLTATVRTARRWLTEHRP